MARPRIFVSSTFYDLRQVRADVEHFIRELGYESVLHESAQISYGTEERREEYAYREVETCDIVVAIIGGRFGTAAQVQPYSISQIELRSALELGKQVYIFVEQSVLAEYETYLKNKKVKNIQYSFVDDPKVYEFLEEVNALPVNNTIAPFETSRDICDYLREQWSGLFQRFLQENERIKEYSILERMQSTAKTLDQLVSFLTQERESQDEAIKSILLSSHPAFSKIKSVLNIPYRVFFTDHDEMASWLEARGYRLASEMDWDGPEFEEWFRADKARTPFLHVKRDIFDTEGNLKIFAPADWDDSWVWLEVLDTAQLANEDDDTPLA